MSSLKDRLPTLKEELTAKALEVYEVLMSRRDRDEITNYELDIGLRTLNDCVGWAIDREASALITMDTPDIDSSFRKSSVFLNAKGTVIMVVFDDDMWGVELRGKLSVATGKWSDIKRFDFDDKVNPMLSALATYKTICQALRDKKYTEIKP